MNNCLVITCHPDFALHPPGSEWYEGQKNVYHFQVDNGTVLVAFYQGKVINVAVYTTPQPSKAGIQFQGLVNLFVIIKANTIV